MPLPPASYTVAHRYLWGTQFDKFKDKTVNLAQNDVQKYEDASSGYNCTFLCSPACFSPASAMSLLAHPPTIPPHPGMSIVVVPPWLWWAVMGEVIRAMVWLQFVPNKWRLSAKFKPFSLLHHCQFSHIYLWSVTTTLLVQVIKGCPLALTWTVLVKWADDNFGKAPAGPIIDGENGHFQSSTKLCRFAGTK